MVNQVRFTPLCGSGGGEAPHCYLLEIEVRDGAFFTLLLDAGWDDALSPALVEPLKSVAGRVDAVLISHPSTYHLGALPYLVGRCGLAAPIYATIPVYRMGQMFVYDHVLSKQAVSDYDAFGLDDVDLAFGRMTQLRYLQEVNFTGKGAGITITPFAAGHMLGGACWRISRLGEEIVYAVDYCHRKEKHLPGGTLDSWAQRPALLITDATAGLRPPVETKRRNEEVLAVLLAALRSDGSVLIPTDTAGRVLEIITVLDKAWAEQKLSYPVVLLGEMCSPMLDNAKLCVEFLSDGLSAKFVDNQGRHPLDARHLRRVAGLDELRRLPPGPKVVLASSASLEWGLSRQLLADWAADPTNVILFTQRCPPDTLAEALQSYTGSEELTLRLTMSRREELTGAELEEALAAQQAATAAATEGVAQEMQVDGGAGEDEEAEAAAAASTSTAAAAAAAASGDSGMPPPPPPPPPLLPHLHTPGAASASRPFSSGRQQPGGGAYTPGGGGYFFSHHADQPMRSSSDVIGRAGGREGGGGGAAGHSPHPNLLSRGGSLAASLASPAASGAGVAAGSASSSSSAVLRKHFVEGFVEMPDAVAPMFPDEGEPDPGSWDEYGEKLPAAVMAAAATAAAAAAAADAAAMADKLMQQQDVGVGGQASKQEEEMEEEPPQKPTKVVDYDVTLTIRAAMRFVDFDGRTDGASLRRIISRVAPRQLVLVHGTQPALVTLKHACQQDLASLGTQICLPSAYETVPLALAPTARVLLSATLLDSLAVSQQGEVKLGWLNGVLQPQKPDRLPAGRAGPLQLVPVLGAAANGNGGGGGADGAHQQQHHGGIFLGDVKLSDLKAELAKAGLAAEFQAGSLLCGPVTVSRSAGQDGRLVVQGALCDEFFRIRDLIYKQYHVC